LSIVTRCDVTGRQIEVIVDRAVQAGGLLGGLAITLMMVHVTVDVVARKLFGAPLPGTLAIVTYYYMVLIAFAPLAAVERVRGHIGIGAIEFVPVLVRHQAWISLVTGFAMALLAWRGWVGAVRDWTIGAVQVQGNAVVPVWPARFLVPFGAGLMAIALFGRFVTYLRGNAARYADP